LPSNRILTVSAERSVVAFSISGPSEALLLSEYQTNAFEVAGRYWTM
jgi:hypothetical protein